MNDGDRITVLEARLVILEHEMRPSVGRPRDTCGMTMVVSSLTVALVGTLLVLAILLLSNMDFQSASARYAFITVIAIWACTGLIGWFVLNPGMGMDKNASVVLAILSTAGYCIFCIAVDRFEIANARETTATILYVTSIISAGVGYTLCHSRDEEQPQEQEGVPDIQQEGGPR